MSGAAGTLASESNICPCRREKISRPLGVVLVPEGWIRMEPTPRFALAPVVCNETPPLAGTVKLFDAGVLEQTFRGEKLVRGYACTKEKSLPSVSVHPPPPRTIAVVESIATA